MATSCEERLGAYYYASRRGLSFCIALMCQFWILTIWGSIHIEETVVGWRTYFGWKPPLTNPRLSTSQRAPPMPLRASSHPRSPNSIVPVVLPSHGTVAGLDYLPEANPGNEPRSLARQCVATPLIQDNGLILPILGRRKHYWRDLFPRLSQAAMFVLQK